MRLGLHGQDVVARSAALEMELQQSNLADRTYNHMQNVGLHRQTD